MTTLREAAQMALEALEYDTRPETEYGINVAIEALRAALAQPEQIECTPMPPVDDDGWCEWSYPIHKGYLMQCCDCGLVHEVEFCVLGNLEPQEDGSKNGEVMGAGYQVGLRMRRHSAQPEQEPVAWGYRDSNGDLVDCVPPHEHARAEGDYTVPLYTALPQREWQGLTYKERCELWNIASTFSPDSVIMHDFAKDIERALKERNS